MTEENNTQNTKTDFTVKRIRTYQGDVEELIKGGKLSLTDIAAAERDKKTKFIQPKNYIEIPKAAPKKSAQEEINILSKAEGAITSGLSKAFGPNPKVNEVNVGAKDILSKQDLNRSQKENLVPFNTQAQETKPLTPPTSESGGFYQSPAPTKPIPQSKPSSLPPSPPFAPKVIVPKIVQKPIPKPTPAPKISKPRTPINLSWVPKFIFFIVVLAGLGFAVMQGLPWLKNKYSELTATDVNVPTGTEILTVDHSKKQINVQGMSRDGVIREILSIKDNSNLPQGGSMTITFNDNIATSTGIGASSFLSYLKTGTPGELTRSLGYDFVFGFYSNSGLQPFIVFKTGYYKNIFAGMLAWEKDIKNDLGPIFIGKESAITASSTKKAQMNNSFEDLTIDKQDTRVLKGSDGKTSIIYAFPDKNTLVITTNENTLKSVINNLSAGKFVK
ncbi:MAG: hypothetical protein WCT19_04035 [Candidatus Paceibacterota bacterium]